MDSFYFISLFSFLSGPSFFRVKEDVMIFVYQHDLTDIEFYLPENKLAIVSPLTHLEQTYLFRRLGSHDAFTHLVFCEALEHCTFFGAIGTWLGSLKNLRYLSIVDTPGLTIYHIEEFFKGLSNSTSLEFLDVSGLDLGPEGALYLSFAVNKLQLKKLHARNNNLQARGISYLLCCTSLVTLNISNNNIHPGRWIKVLENVSRNIEKFTSHNNIFSNSGFFAFTQYVINSKMRQLDISHTSLSFEQCCYLCDNIANHPTLRILKLHNCNIEMNAMTSFAEMLRKNCRLSQLQLTENSIGLDGTLKLVWALQKNYTLLQLHIDPINGIMQHVEEISDSKNSDLRLLPVQGETLNAYILRLICSNQDLNLACQFWKPHYHFYYPFQAQQRVITFLWCLQKHTPLPLDLHYYILNFWQGNDLL